MYLYTPQSCGSDIGITVDRGDGGTQELLLLTVFLLYPALDQDGRLLEWV